MILKLKSFEVEITSGKDKGNNSFIKVKFNRFESELLNKLSRFTFRSRKGFLIRTTNLRIGSLTMNYLDVAFRTFLGDESYMLVNNKSIMLTTDVNKLDIDNLKSILEDLDVFLREARIIVTMCGTSKYISNIPFYLKDFPSFENYVLKDKLELKDIYGKFHYVSPKDIFKINLIH